MDEYLTVRKPQKWTAGFKYRTCVKHTILFVVFSGGIWGVGLALLSPWLALPSGGSQAAHFAMLLLLGCIAIIGPLMVFPSFDIGKTIKQWRRDEIERSRANGLPHFAVEINLDPPLITGLEKRIDNADDVGVLILEDETIRYEGDAVRFRTRGANVALFMSGTNFRKGFGVYGEAICLQMIAPLGGYCRISLLVRDGNTIFEARRLSRELKRRICALATEGEACKERTRTEP